MKTIGKFLLWMSGAAFVATAAPVAGEFVELRRIHAPEARQGVAADENFLYAISNHALGRYDRRTGERTGGWECPEGEPLIHLNAGIVREGLLYAAHSNYPGVPHVSSVEIWEVETLRHVRSVNFGRTDGSLTWIDRRDTPEGARWIGCFVHYGKKGGEPGRGPEWTRLVEFDEEWSATGRGWVFPADLMACIAGRGYSVSGGAIGPGGRLYVTGHDEPELYVLEFPEAGSVLHWTGVVPVPAEGQAFAWDPGENGMVHLILKRTREIITGRVQPLAP